jgi:mitotic spindle assembly checkpoint protein MAD2
MFAAAWLLDGNLQRLVLVITSVASKEVLERWAFDIEADGAVAADEAVTADGAVATDG